MSEHLSAEETRRAYSLTRIDENNDIRILPTTSITFRLTNITLDQTSTRDSRFNRTQRPQTAGYICRRYLSAEPIGRKQLTTKFIDRRPQAAEFVGRSRPTECRSRPTECPPDLATECLTNKYYQTNKVPHQTNNRPTKCLTRPTKCLNRLVECLPDLQSAYQTYRAPHKYYRVPHQTNRVPITPTTCLIRPT